MQFLNQQITVFICGMILHYNLLINLNSVIKNIVHQFLQAYQIICINYSIRNEFINLAKESLDLYISSLYIPTTKLIIREELINLKSQIVASPEYLIKHITPHKISDLEQHNCITHQHAQYPNIWRFGDGELIEIHSNLLHNTLSNIVKAAKSGLGLALVPKLYIQQESSNQELCVVLPELISYEFKIYIYYNASNHRKNVMSMFLDFLKKRVTGLIEIKR